MIIEDLPWLLPAPDDFRARCAEAERGAQAPARELIRLASSALSVEQLIKLARTRDKLQAAGADLKELKPFRLGLVSNATVDFIAPAIAASGLRHGLLIEVVVPDFGQVMQAVADVASPLYADPLDAVLFALDQRALGLGEGRASADAIGFLKTLREQVATHCGAISILQTLARIPEPLQGSLDASVAHSARAEIQAFNTELPRTLEGTADILLDVGALAETAGLARWHDAPMWHVAKMPFAQAMVPIYAEQVARLAAAIVGKARKCLVLDLDNTIWGGVIGDDGMEGIRLGQGDSVGEAFLAIQRHALELGKRGIILAVCSKNEDGVATRPFREHPEMLLREEHIAAFQANWVDKAENLRVIAKKLNIGTDSLVFLDDNPAERAIIRKELPEVAVPELPSDPAYYPRTLSMGGYFDNISLSAEDLKRSEFYRSQIERTQLQESSSDVEGYLRSLDMKLDVARFEPVGRGRVAQLINKTNQFNLTTKRYSEAEVARMEQDPSLITIQARLADSFGDNGMISVIICRADGPEWRIDTWLMSCRVLGRRVEQALANLLFRAAGEAGATSIVGEFIPTDRNSLVNDHYLKLGFEKVEEAGEVSLWRRDVASFEPFDVPMDTTGQEAFERAGLSSLESIK